jgi:hypothetical protein
VRSTTDETTFKAWLQTSDAPVAPRRELLRTRAFAPTDAAAVMTGREGSDFDTLDSA